MSNKRIDETRDLVVRLFGFEVDQLTELVIDNGLAYLDIHYPTDNDIRSALSKHPKFWTWFRELWAERDRKILACCHRCSGHIRYEYPITAQRASPIGGGYEHNQVLVSTPIPLCEAWDFYTKYHKPARIEYFPNYVLIDECLTETSNNLSTL
jgi:hypothetical protein